jgi:hypothetical protein
MTPYERRRLELEYQDWRLRVYSLERSLDAANEAFTRIKGRLNSVNRAIDLGFAHRRQLEIMSELANARARAATFQRALAGPQDQFADHREREEVGLALLSRMSE